jgi:hypothetical protein
MRNPCPALPLALGLAVLAFPGAREAAAEPLQPSNLEKLNTTRDEDEPHVASNLRRLYYATDASGKWEIRVSQRRATNQPWPPGKPVEDLQSKADCRSVFVTPEGTYPQRLFFATNRDPEKEDARGGNFDLYFVIKQLPSSDFTTATPIHPVCTAADELHPWLTKDNLKLYFSRNDKDAWHVYVAKRASAKEQFGKPVRVELPDGFHHATLTPNGRTMYLQGPLEKERWGLFRSSLSSERWSRPEPLDDLNSADAPTGDRSPNLSRDGLFLYFASDRPGGKGGLDLWVIPTAQLNRAK